MYMNLTTKLTLIGELSNLIIPNISPKTSLNHTEPHSDLHKNGTALLMWFTTQYDLQ